MTLLGSQIETMQHLESRRISGRVAAVRGLTVLVDDLPLPIGTVIGLEQAGIGGTGTGLAADGEIVGFDGDRSVVMLYRSTDGLSPGAQVVGHCAARAVSVGRSQLGRVLDGLGRPADGGGTPANTVARALHAPIIKAMDRRRIVEPLPTGVRVIDAMLTLGRGQRIGIFSGPGVGKSTLLASIARNTAADINVIALIGERGREVREFIESALGPEGLARSVVVVATGDESPLLRVRAALTACSIAEWFRDDGADVLLMMDSVTRLAQALRQIGLTAGEQPATKGYTPSVFAQLPIVLERAGSIEGSGSITGLYTVLVEGDDLTEPVSDAARGILDGHIALSRRLAGRGHYPAIDLLESISRLADDVCDEPHIASRRLLLRLIAAYSEAEELINIGAYAGGSNPDVDVAIAMKPAFDAFLQQNPHDKAEYAQTCGALIELATQVAQRLGRPQRRAGGI